MQFHLMSLLSPPESSSYEEAQIGRLAHVMLLTTMAGSLVLGIANFLHGWLVESLCLFGLVVVSAAGSLLNHYGHRDLASFVLCVSLFAAIGALLYEGKGLQDEVVLAYPLCILASAFLLRRRGLVLSTIGSVATIMLIYELEAHGVQITQPPDTLYRAGVTSFLLVITASMIGVVRSTWLSHLDELQRTYDLTLQGWGKALEYRDGETAGHSRRVSELCSLLGRKLGCKEAEIIQLRRGAYLHDIGKMVIPDSILLKRGRFTDEEWQLMRQHTALGVELIANIPYLQPVATILSSHHENWDGTGYPLGLKEESIPLAARMFTVVDQWDALNSNRPYRKAWPRDQVIAYMQANSGKIFDPRILKAFLELVQEDSMPFVDGPGPDRAASANAITEPKPRAI